MNFHDWRVQSRTIRHSAVGSRLSRDQAEELIALFAESGFYAWFVAANGTVRVKFGTTDRLHELWCQFGSESLAQKKRDAAKLTAETTQRERQASEQVEMQSLPSIAWINTIFGETAMNDYNRLMLARFLDGKTDRFQGLPSHAWLNGLVSIGALTAGDRPSVDFKAIKQVYQATLIAA